MKVTTKRKRLWWISGALFAFLCLCFFVANRDPYGTAQFDFLKGADFFDQRLVRNAIPSRPRDLYLQFTLRAPYGSVLEEAVRELKAEGWKTLTIDHMGASFGKGNETVYLVRGSLDQQGDAVFINYTRPATWLDKTRLWLERLGER